MKGCPRCARSLPIDEFSVRTNGRPTSFCKGCQRANSREHYRNNKHKHNASRLIRTKVERVKIRRFIQEAKSVPCADCNESHPYWAMDFDHRDPSTKKFDMATAPRTGSMHRTMQEAEKCDVVCALCHRYRTNGERRSERGVA